MCGINFENLDVLRLELRAPLFYIEEGGVLPFARLPESGTEEGGAVKEYIFRFRIGEIAGKAIDPNPAGYLGDPVFSGRRAEERGAAGAEDTVRPGRVLELSGGAYFFAQAREALNREECTLMAIEVQREILWQRLLPREDLY
ncbi:MAG: hypothetical protein LBG42_02975, partial [Treponema sp.]|nr:hypothetical protein [Treponema sp.]